MALIVEDGTGVVGADAFISLADANIYHADYGNAAWFADGVEIHQKEAAIRKATAWLDARYRWAGSIASTAQALAWPRVGAWDADGREVASNAVPLRLRYAAAEAALYALSNDLLPSQQGAAVKSEAIGPIRVEYFGAGNTGAVSLPWVDALVGPLALGPARGSGRGGMVILERA
jgi:hypothetical protein